MVAILGKITYCLYAGRQGRWHFQLARVIEIFGKRLQAQETMTAQIVVAFSRA